jgi:hypothetical protein
MVVDVKFHPVMALVLLPVLFNILINAFIFYYIYGPYVKSFFGKATTTTAVDTTSLME